MKYEILLQWIYYLDDLGLDDAASWYNCQWTAQNRVQPVTYTKFIGEV
jgi:hypothetical protein